MACCSARAIGDPDSLFYVEALTRLERASIEFLVGGAFAHFHYSKIKRETKDLDIFLRRKDLPGALALFEAAGFRTELTFPHWLAKVYDQDQFMDLIFSSGNGVARVDDLWFDHAVPAEVFGLRVRICPPEEMIWSKAFIQERERFDGADVLHLFRRFGPELDWPRLLMRFGDHWRLLFAHIIMFGFVYPDQRDRIPQWVVEELTQRLLADRAEPANNLCYGTLLSREQYLYDLERLGYRDARLVPRGQMTKTETKLWTNAIWEDK